MDGDADNGSIMSGQVAAMVNVERSTKRNLGIFNDRFKSWSRSFKKKIWKLEYIENFNCKKKRSYVILLQ